MGNLALGRNTVYILMQLLRLMSVLILLMRYSRASAPGDHHNSATGNGKTVNKTHLKITLQYKLQRRLRHRLQPHLQAQLRRPNQKPNLNIYVICTARYVLRTTDYVKRAVDWTTDSESVGPTIPAPILYTQS